MADLSMSAAEFQSLYEDLCRMSTWRGQERRGALNNLTPARLAAAAIDAQAGRTVSLAATVDHEAS